MRLVSYQSNGGWRSGIEAGDLVPGTEQMAASAASSKAERRPARQPSGPGARAELAVVIGRRARKIETGQALEYVAGAMAFNDASVCDLQMAGPL